MKKQEMGRQAVYQRTCEWCGKDFEAHWAAARYCTSACRLRYFRWKERLSLAMRNAEKAIEDLAYFTQYEPTSSEAWADLVSLRVKLLWYLETDPVGTRKMPL